MKEKIKEIAMKTKLGSANFDNGVNYYVGTDDTFEKFADMLVKHIIKDIENTNILNSCATTTYDMSVAECARESIINMIKNEYSISYEFLEKEKSGL
jgi:hypothetical protein